MLHWFPKKFVVTMGLVLNFSYFFVNYSQLSLILLREFPKNLVSLWFYSKAVHDLSQSISFCEVTDGNRLLSCYFFHFFNEFRS